MDKVAEFKKAYAILEAVRAESRRDGDELTATSAHRWMCEIHNYAGFLGNRDCDPKKTEPRWWPI